MELNKKIELIKAKGGKFRFFDLMTPAGKQMCLDDLNLELGEKLEFYHF